MCKCFQKRYTFLKWDLIIQKIQSLVCRKRYIIYKLGCVLISLISAVIIGFHSTVKVPIALWEWTKQQIKVNERELETRVTGNIVVLLIFDVESQQTSYQIFITKYFEYIFSVIFLQGKMILNKHLSFIILITHSLCC